MLKILNILNTSVCSNIAKASASTSALPKVLSEWSPPRQVWLENMSTVEEKKVGIIELNNSIFGAAPRIDIVHQNIEWQRKYRFVSFAHTKTRNEVRGGGRKPWPQKGLGRARHGSIRSPLWRGGGIAHGPRSPTTHFYMLPFYNRVLGLVSTLSIKLAQDDLHVVNDLEIPTDDPQYLKDLVAARLWGPSVLFVDSSDVLPTNISVGAETINHINLMPVYGLNVYSMLKHNTLVLTESAIKDIERKLLEHLNRTDARALMSKFRYDK
ncbi:large ribosomal subunit protein uL4m [Anopheles ziemanni]|uniref:large ribosomal subunit protein uL4m n=1 Tax=Anopheles coustani TaxID=139045 RepID=UPI0026585E89|nr:large ribosomal subunit protein uL4m [Anopheles coustani]XP_058172198.1 large ribosomal subunit protein uL4m [Anopheles ziemanni]